jgi:hypothetical protein
MPYPRISSQNHWAKRSRGATDLVVEVRVLRSRLDWSQHQIEGFMMTSESKKCTNQVYILDYCLLAVK